MQEELQKQDFLLKNCQRAITLVKNQSSMTSVKYNHLLIMETITKKFHQNPLKNIGGVAEKRTSVDKMAKIDKGP